jgi:hypothetical protein
MSDQPKTTGQRSVESDAYTRGHRQGFLKGVEDKAWLHRSWPLFTLALCLVSMLVGFAIGVSI